MDCADGNNMKCKYGWVNLLWGNVQHYKRLICDVCDCLIST